MNNSGRDLLHRDLARQSITRCHGYAHIAVGDYADDLALRSEDGKKSAVALPHDLCSSSEIRIHTAARWRLHHCFANPHGCLHFPEGTDTPGVFSRAVVPMHRLLSFERMNSARWKVMRSFSRSMDAEFPENSPAESESGVAGANLLFAESAVGQRTHGGQHDQRSQKSTHRFRLGPGP